MVLSLWDRARLAADSCFIDPDGHPWEIAFNPHWTLTADGGITLS